MSHLITIIIILYLTQTVVNTIVASQQIFFAISFALRLVVCHFNCELQLLILRRLTQRFADPGARAVLSVILRLVPCCDCGF